MRSAKITPYLTPLEAGSREQKTSNSSAGVVRVSKTGGANGKIAISKQREREIRRIQMIDTARRFGLFELFWYPTFIIGGLLCLLLIRPTTFDLVFAVINLFAFMTANNLVARGKRVGLLISTISMMVYCVICYINKVWGELIINVCMYIPLEIMGFIKWKKDNEEKAEERIDVKKLTFIGYLMMFGVIAGLTAGIFAILHFGLEQDHAIFNALSIAACLVGGYARNHQYIETWLLYIIANLASIALWGCQAFGTEVLTLSVLPIILSYSSTLTNDFNGWAIWEIVYRKNNKKEGIYLAKRKVKISRIAKLKKASRKFVCRETDDVVGLKFRTR